MSNEKIINVDSPRYILCKHLPVEAIDSEFFIKYYQNLKNALSEYAEQFINLAAQEAKVKMVRTMWQGMDEAVEIPELDRNSILEIKKLIK